MYIYMYICVFITQACDYRCFAHMLCKMVPFELAEDHYEGIPFVDVDFHALQVMTNHPKTPQNQSKSPNQT